GGERLHVNAFMDGHLRRAAARRAAQQQPDVQQLAVRVDAELARGVMARTGAVHARSHDGGQATLTHGPKRLAVSIHYLIDFRVQRSAGGQAATPLDQTVHTRARPIRRAESSGSGVDRATDQLWLRGSAYRSISVIVAS